jgi:ketosteroid isomerase-like protein
MDRTATTQTILESYDCRWRNDRDGALACFHSNAKVASFGDTRVVPFAGLYRGLNEVRTYLDRLDTRAQSVPILQDLIVDGSRGVVRWMMPMQSERAKTAALLQLVDIVTVDQGLIVSVDQFHDTGVAAILFSEDLREGWPVAV